jgi:geranylgeranyl diphosphate synthase type II
MDLERLFSVNPADPEQKIRPVIGIYLRSGAAEQTQKEIQNYTGAAFTLLDHLNLPEEKVGILRQFGEKLMLRVV